MADNFAATPGSGATFGMDEVVDGTLGTVKVGFGKIMDGTLDSTNKLIVNASGEALVKNTTGDTSLASIDGKITAVNTGAVVVSSSALPSGASTAAKQPAIGTAGTASADVITVQGKALMTPILTDGSATTQPVSGTVTADTELPAAAALADTTANPTVPGVGTYLMGWDGTGAVWDRLKQQGLNADAQTAHVKGVLETASNGYVFNGTTWDRAKGDATNGAFVNVKTSVLPTGAATSALQTQPGVDIGDVTINNAAGAAAVNIQDGGNSITIDGTVAVSTNSELGIVTETAPATDTASSGLNGRLQRIAQRLTSLITALGSPFQAGGSIGNTSFAATQATGTNLHTVVDSGNIAVTGSVTATLASTTITGTVAVTDNAGSLTVDAPVGTPAFVRLSDGAAAITTLPVSLASVPSHAVTNAGTFAVQSAATLAAETTKVIGVVRTADGSGNLLSSTTNALDVNLKTSSITLNTNESATATGGYTPNKLISAATTNATSIKGSAGTLGFVSATNINAAARYLKFYNKATAPTVGTDVPLLVYLIPGNTAGAGTNIVLPSEGANFTTGIAFAITTGAADSDTGAVAANEIIINYGTI